MFSLYLCALEIKIASHNYDLFLEAAIWVSTLEDDYRDGELEGR